MPPLSHPDLQRKIPAQDAGLSARQTGVQRPVTDVSGG